MILAALQPRTRALLEAREQQRPPMPFGQRSLCNQVECLVGQIEPGGRINVRQLEQHFGVSHIPIREAIRRLEAEGLVVNVPKRGAVAAGVSLSHDEGVYRPSNPGNN